MMRQYHFPLPLRESLKEEDYLVGKTNEKAVFWLLKNAPGSWPSHAALIWGPDGAGKSHLLSIWAEKWNAPFLAPRDEKIEDIVKGSGACAFALDDADRLAGDAEAEEWLQHLFNATKAASAPFLMAARRPPSLWGVTLKDIETRLKSCHMIEILEPDDELVRGLLFKLFTDRQLIVETGVIDYLAVRLERTGAAIRRAVAVLDEAALESGRKISIPFAQRALMLNEETVIL